MEEALSQIQVLVVDCQSTGARPKHGSLIELAWCSARAGVGEAPSVTSHLLALPDGESIPRPVTRITGITEEDLVDAVDPEHAYRELLGCAAAVPPIAEGRTPTVIHYASYEKAWLAHLQDTYGGADLVSLDVVCTHEIAKRLLRLPRQGIRALAGYYGFAPELVRRSAGHVMATQHVWRHLAAELAEIGVVSWGELHEWLADTPPLSRKDRTLPMDRDKRLSLPDKPGVYRMLRKNGDVLYVGKATSLKRRVNSYFTKRRGHNERTMEMLTQVQDVDVTVTETAVEAALVEADAIKDRRPPYNVQLRNETRDAWFASPDLMSAAIEPDMSHRLGPLPSRFALASYAALRALVVHGADSVPREIAKATAMPARFAPGQEEFAPGVDLFAQRYNLAELTHACLMSLSKQLLSLARAGKLDEGDRDESDHSWDPPRVARHLERVVMQAGQLMRRSRWLCLLSEATVSWHVAGAPVRRLLVVEQAAIVERSYLPADQSAPPPRGARRSQRDRQRSFDIAAYDRLRILSTELKRITAEAREVDVWLSDRIVLRGAALKRLLSVV